MGYPKSVVFPVGYTHNFINFKVGPYDPVAHGVTV